MRPLGPSGALGPRRDRRRPIVALSIATLVIVPWALVDAIGGGEEPSQDPTTQGVASTSAAPSETSTSAPTTVPTEESAEAGTYPQVTLAASWLPRGTSRYSETDDQTRSRMRRQKLGQVASPAPAVEDPGAVTTTAPTKQTTAPEVTTTVPKKQEPVPSPPRETQPPATQAPSTAAPVTPPPPTAPPATDPPPPAPDPSVVATPSGAEAQA